MLIASLVALTKDNLKARLAYSTVSQLSYITLGAALAQPASVVGAGMHIAMHAVGKITLFFCAGAIYVATHKTEVSQMRGLGRQMPLTMAAFLLGSLSIIGLPPFGGVWSKWFLSQGAVAAHQPMFVAVLMVSSLLNIAYLLPVAIAGFFGRPEAASGDHQPQDRHPRSAADVSRAAVSDRSGWDRLVLSGPMNCIRCCCPWERCDVERNAIRAGAVDTTRCVDRGCSPACPCYCWIGPSTTIRTIIPILPARVGGASLRV